jgi:hypothetical protein
MCRYDTFGKQVYKLHRKKRDRILKVVQKYNKKGIEKNAVTLSFNFPV